MLSAGFGALATLLASIGLYGVMAFVVARRTKELGIRLALGAQPGIVIWMVLREVLILLAIGLVIGIPSAMSLGHYVAAQLYGIKASDPAIAGWTILLLSVVSAAAGLIPAQRGEDCRRIEFGKAHEINRTIRADERDRRQVSDDTIAADGFVM